MLFPDHGVGANWAVNVLEVLLAYIDELNRHLASDIIVGRRRDADAARFCDALKPRRNVHAIPKDVIRLDNYVADVDADSKGKAAVFCVIRRQIANGVLEIRRRSNRFDRARKLCQKIRPRCF